MSWALLEIGTLNGAGVKITRNAVFEAGRLAIKRTTVNPRLRPLGLLDWEKRLFQANFPVLPEKAPVWQEPAPF
jgi:hypothetical protein